MQMRRREIARELNQDAISLPLAQPDAAAAVPLVALNRPARDLVAVRLLLGRPRCDERAQRLPSRLVDDGAS